MSFVHLHVHSHYSKGKGVGTIEELCQAARDLGIRQMALTDTNGLYGLISFLHTARDMGIMPIVGSELVSDTQRALLLVKNSEGYANLCRIISARHCDGAFHLGRTLRDLREGLVVLSDNFQLLKDLRRDSVHDLFVEMSPGYQMAGCHAFSRRTGIPPVATNRVYLARKDQFGLHRILRAIDRNTTLSRLCRDQLCQEHNFLNAPKDMVDQYPHAPEAIAHTARIAEACLKEWSFEQTIFPRFQGLEDEEAFSRLYQATLAGCRERYGAITEEVRARVEHEMAIIRAKNFAHYFLVVADITRKAGRSCGRGSAAASIVAYALKITHVDPIRHHLFFERFLNPDRTDPPDIDVDFPWDERDLVLDGAFARYGNRRMAMVANHNTFGPRSAIREAAKVFGLADSEIEAVTGRIGFGWRLQESWQDLARHPKMRGVPFERPWDEILTAAFQLQGRFHHLGTHCGGVVVVPDEIRRYCPVEISGKGPQILQWEKEAVEDAGLVKMDILGNRSLAVIRDALESIHRNGGPRIEYARFQPLDDPDTIRIFYEGNTFGVFYFESPATRQVLTQLKSGMSFDQYRTMDHFLLNVIVTSIIRPASNQSIHTWLSRLHGEPWVPPHPLLGPVLQETLGVMVFQEQLSQAAMHLAGFSPAEADTLRKTVSKKNRERRLRDFHVRFGEGARARGVSEEVIREVWDMILGFDGYSFCKPHSASYTLVAYKSAYLRAHYPAEFMASVISNGGGYYSALGYLSEARRMGILVLPPDINHSRIPCTGRGRVLRMGFMQLKSLSLETQNAILEERNRNGPFVSFANFLKRIAGLHPQDVQILIKGGCFDRIAPRVSRSERLWQCLAFFARKETKRPRTLFDQGDLACSPPPPPSTLDSRKTLLRHEQEVFGFPLSVHPLALYEQALRGRPCIRARDLPSHVGKEVILAGWPVTGKTVLSSQGDPMKFITFEDQTGIYETVLFPGTYGRYSHLLHGQRPFVLRGRVAERLGAIHVVVERIQAV